MVYRTGEVGNYFLKKCHRKGYNENRQGNYATRPKFKTHKNLYVHFYKGTERFNLNPPPLLTKTKSPPSLKNQPQKFSSINVEK